MENAKTDYESLIRICPDFPKPGIQFVDWMPVLNNADAFRHMLSDTLDLLKGEKFTKLAGLESRGLLLGVPMAVELGIPFVPIRKKGKLPGKVVKETYHLEYGLDSMEIQDGMITPDDKVLIVDDLLATGGTIGAANSLVSRFTSNYKDLFLIELMELGGRSKLECPFFTLLKMYGIY